MQTVSAGGRPEHERARIWEFSTEGDRENLRYAPPIQNAFSRGLAAQLIENSHQIQVTWDPFRVYSTPLF